VRYENIHNGVKGLEKEKILITKTPIRARFSEIDAMTIVWHGNYVKFLEDGREDFGIKYGLDYMSVYEAGYMTPVVKMNIEYKAPIFYGQDAVVETVFVNSPAAKIVFEYKIVCAKTGNILTTATTQQVFINAETRDLELTPPPFFIDWKKSNGLEI
jgi:acyl-CoA thioester hydrolase